MNIVRSAVATAILSGCSLATAHADSSWEDHFQFSGFGTLGAVQTDDTQAEFGHNREVGGATDLNLGVDSDLGVQLTAIANSWLSATVQELVAKRDKDQFQAEVEWAFVKIQPLSNLTVRAGRMPLPTFVVSDSLYVGYANTWLRAPNEVYGLALPRRMEGTDVTYREPLGPVAVSVTALFGKTSLVAYDTNYVGNNVTGGNVQLETPWVTFRAGKIATEVDVSAQNPADRYTFTGFGATMDHDNVIFQAEYVMRRSDYYYNIVAANGWYVMGGYHLKAFTPYMIFSSTTPENSTTHVPVQLEIPPISNDQKTFALGVRWDAFSSVDFKAQVERVDTKGTSGISFSNPLAESSSLFFETPITRPVNVASIAVDFVF